MEDRRNKSSARTTGAGGDSPAADEAARPRERGSFGAWLRTQREARGVSIQAIAETSKISLRYLQAMEGDRFDVLPAPVFVRGFLREYARVVGLDADEVVNFYLLAQPAVSGERGGEARAAAPRGEREPMRRASLVGYGVMIAALLALFVGIAAAISWWASRRAERAAAPAAVAAPAASSAAAAAPAGPAAERASVPSESAAAPPAAAPVAVAPAAGAGSAAPAADRLRVVLEFQQDCWVEVVVDGQRRESELKAGGETLALEATDYVSLTLGNGPAVRVEVNGQPFPLTAQDSRVVRDLRIDRAALAALGPAAAAAHRP